MATIQLSNGLVLEVWEDTDREIVKIKFRFPHNKTKTNTGTCKKSGFVLQFTRELLESISFDIPEGSVYPSKKLKILDEAERLAQKQETEIE
jgi:hypothetical protein